MNEITTFDRTVTGWLEAGGPSDVRPEVVEGALRIARTVRPRRQVLGLVGPAAWPPIGVRGAFAGLIRRPAIGLSYLLIVMGLILALVAAAFVASNVHNDPPDPTVPLGGNGLIAYEIVVGTVAASNSRVHLMNADGSGDREIGAGSPDSVDRSSPAFSADGRVFAYMSTDVLGTTRIVVSTPDGDQIRSIDLVRPSSFVVGPDGVHVALVRQLTGVSAPYELVLVNLADGSEQTLVEDPSFIGGPNWSPDGRSIAYVTSPSPETRIGPVTYGDGVAVVHVATAEVRQITTRLGTGGSAAWSPDGQTIAFAAWRDAVTPPTTDSSIDWDELNTDIFVINIDGTGERNLTSSPGIDERPTWSPDGSAIAFLTVGDLGYQAAAIDMSGLQPVGAMRLGPPASQLIWSPDATNLLLHHEHPVEEGGTERGIIQTVDSRFEHQPVTLLDADYPVGLGSWQRLTP